MSLTQTKDSDQTALCLQYDISTLTLKIAIAFYLTENALQNEATIIEKIGLGFFLDIMLPAHEKKGEPLSVTEKKVILFTVAPNQLLQEVTDVLIEGSLTENVRNSKSIEVKTKFKGLLNGMEVLIQRL